MNECAVGMYTESFLQEWGVEEDSTTLANEKKFYNRFITASRSKTENLEELDDRIKVLKQCSNQMKQALKDDQAGADNSERVKYVLKAWIPFNAIVRLIKKHDNYAGISILVGILTGGIGVIVCRAITWDKMIEDQIDQTDKAIEYLEEMRKKVAKER